MKPDNMKLTKHHVNRIIQGPPRRGLIRDAISCVGLVALFIAVVYVAYGFGIGGM